MKGTKEPHQITTFGVKEMEGYTKLFNLYGLDNMQCEQGDECFFLLCGMQKYYFPLILQGRIIYLSLGTGQERLYYITPTKVIDPSIVVEKFLDEQQFDIYSFVVDKDKFVSFNASAPKAFIIKPQDLDLIHTKPTVNFFNTNNTLYRTFAVNAFYVRGFVSNNDTSYRDQLHNIVKFRREYVEYFKHDTENMLKEMDYLISINDSDIRS